jgi:FkbM family methyltransferase
VEERLGRMREEIVREAYERGRHAALREHQQFGPAGRLMIAPTAQVNDALFNTVSGAIVVGEHAFFGHGVAVLTGTHDISVRGPRRSEAIPPSGRDIEIGAGVWVASRATLIGPCRIGADAVVAAGAVVTGDVPAGAVVAGVPARVVRHLGAHGGIPPALDVETDVGRMFVHAHDEVITPILRDRGGWDPEETAALRAALQPGMTVLDVGANIGYVTLLAANAVGPSGRVIAVEPHPANVRLLRANTGRHGLQSRVEIVAAAAWDAEGTVELAECASNTGDHRVGALTGERPLVRVPSVTLDEVAGDAEVGLLKLDTQATEHVALRGARKLVERCRPLILAEFWPAGIREMGDDPLAVLRGYADLGYDRRVLEEDGLDSASDEEVVARVDARPAPFGGFVTLELRPRS